MATRLRGSKPFAYVTSNSRRNARALASVSWMLTPRNTTSASRCRRHAASRSRASARHGGHHEAQKLRKTTFPRRSTRPSARQSISRSVNGGAGRPISGEGIPRGSRVNPYARTATSGTPRRNTRTSRRQATSGLRARRPERPEGQHRTEHHHAAADPDPADERPDHDLHRRLPLPERAQPRQDHVEVVLPAHAQHRAAERRLLGGEELERRRERSEVVPVVEDPERRLDALVRGPLDDPEPLEGPREPGELHALARRHGRRPP